MQEVSKRSKPPPPLLPPPPPSKRKSNGGVAMLFVLQLFLKLKVHPHPTEIDFYSVQKDKNEFMKWNGLFKATKACELLPQKEDYSRSCGASDFQDDWFQFGQFWAWCIQWHIQYWMLFPYIHIFLCDSEYERKNRISPQNNIPGQCNGEGTVGFSELPVISANISQQVFISRFVFSSAWLCMEDRE